MSDAFRKNVVAVAVILDQPSGKYLLVHNHRWNGYAFPMKHIDPGIDPAAAAMSAVRDRDFPFDWPHARATPLDRIAMPLQSLGVHEATGYDYHVFAIDPGEPLDTGDLNTDLWYATYAELVASPTVTYSTQSIARALVEERRVAVAAIERPSPSGKEYLLVAHPNGQEFFPSTRMKEEMFPAQAIVELIRHDLEYEGAIEVGIPHVVDVVQPSSRFVPGDRRFHFHLCCVDFPGVDVTAPGNPLETSLNAVQAALHANNLLPPAAAYWHWANEAVLRAGAGLSPSIPPLLPTLLQ